MLSMRGAVVEPAVPLVEAGGVTRSGPQAEGGREVWKGENVALRIDFCNYCTNPLQPIAAVGNFVKKRTTICA